MTTRALEDHEIKSVFEHIDGYNAKRNETLLVVAIGMALRASELTGLNVGDVFDGRKAKTYVTIRGETAKYGKERETRVWNIVADKITEFKEWKVEHGESIDPDAPLFVSREGGYLTRQALFEIVKKIFRAADVKQSCHALRKTGATIFYLASRYDITATQQFLGHASPESTRRYIGIPSQKVKEYSITSSEWLANAIEYGEFDILPIASNSEEMPYRYTGHAARGLSNSTTLNLFQTSELIVELQARGIDMSSAIEQMQVERRQQGKGKVIPFPRAQRS